MASEPDRGGPRPAGHPDLPEDRIGVLLVNLGTPDAPEPRAIRRYLREFLSDRRVIEANRLVWALVLNLVVLNIRPAVAARAYREVWDRETGESPLRRHTREQAAGLAARLAGLGVEVDWAMRYGAPPIAERLEALRARGCRRVLLAPLYPQYSAATTATACDKAFAALAGMRWQPAVRIAPPYYDDPAYIAALAGSVRTHLATLDWRPDALLASFHGLPQRYFEAGDPYHCHCAKTARLLDEALGGAAGRVETAFQSRFGREEWLRPYAADVIVELPARGVRRLAMIAPGFAADCVETLEEAAIGLRAAFLEAGGEAFAYIPCLNASPAGIDLLESLARRELSGWLPDAPAAAARAS